MSWLWETLGWLGLGGAATAIGLAYFLPGLLPTIVVKLVLGVVDAALAVLSYVGSKLTTGLQHIAKSRPAVFTLIFALLFGGYLGDGWDWVRPYVPALVRSEPPPQTRNAPKPKRVVTRTPQGTQTSAFDDFLNKWAPGLTEH